MKTFDYQAEIHRNNARFRLLCGGRRLGKSVMGGREAVAQLMIPGSWVWLVGPTMDLAEKEFRVVWRNTVTKQTLPVARKSERELFIKFKNGSFIECRSEEQPDQLIGEGLDLAVLVECARLKDRTWHQYIRPALADRKGRAFFSSTPRGFNWFEEFFRRGQSDDPEFVDWASWQIPSIRNPLLGRDEIEDARRTSTPEAFAQEWEAKFIHYAGLVFPEFDATIHANETFIYNEYLKTCLFVDPGTTAPYAVLLVQITPDEQIRVIDEVYRTGMTTGQILKIVQEKWPRLYDTSFKMPRPDVDVIIDEAAAEAAATWRLAGWRAWGKKPKIRQAIEVHHRFLRDPDQSRMPWTDGPDDPGLIVPRIKFDPRCFNTIREHGAYHYPDDTRKRIETNKPDLPVDIDNHAIDALRYGYFNLFPELFNISMEEVSIGSLDLQEMMRQREAAYGDESGLEYNPFDPGLIEDYAYAGVARGFSRIDY